MEALQFTEGMAAKITADKWRQRRHCTHRVGEQEALVALRLL